METTRTLYVNDEQINLNDFLAHFRSPWDLEVLESQLKKLIKYINWQRSK